MSFTHELDFLQGFVGVCVLVAVHWCLSAVSLSDLRFSPTGRLTTSD
jgi:hypothetical protein